MDYRNVSIFAHVGHGDHHVTPTRGVRDSDAWLTWFRCACVGNGGCYVIKTVYWDFGRVYCHQNWHSWSRGWLHNPYKYFLAMDYTVGWLVWSVTSRDSFRRRGFESPANTFFYAHDLAVGGRYPCPNHRFLPIKTSNLLQMLPIFFWRIHPHFTNQTRRCGCV